MNASPFRYFAVVGLHPAHSLAVLAAVLVLGLWTVVMNPAELDSALGMVLFVQMFLASSGFMVWARRGQFDAVLACASDRRRTVVSHWCVSVLPGALAWTALAGAARVLGGASSWSAFVGRRAAAMFIVSALAWTAGFFLTRGAAGALWIAALVAALLRRVDLLGASPASLLTASSVTVLRHAATVVFCPFLLIGTHAPLAPGAVCAAICLTAVLLLSVWRRAATLDIYLMDRA